MPHLQRCFIPSCVAMLGIVAGRAAAQDLALREQEAFRAAVARVAPAVVSIETIGGLDQVGEVLVGTGSSCGLVVDPDGFIVSSSFNFAHRPASIIVTLADGTRAAAQLAATDETRKLVLLKVEVGKKLPTVEPVPQAEIRVGMWAVAVGRGFDAAQPNVSVGIVSAVNRIWGKAVQTDAKISPANYGGPLLDVRGRVVGVLVPLSPTEHDDSSGFEWYDSGIGFAVPLEHVLRVLPRLKAGENLKPGVVGVRFQGGNIYADPPRLAHVRANSPAFKAGLRRGDSIVAVDGRRVALQVQVSEQLQRRYAGDTVRLEIARGDEKFERELTLVEKLDPYRRPFLGILPQRTTPAAGEGVEVRHVYADSPAARLKIAPGDRVLAVNGRAVADRDALATAVAEAEPGKSIELEIGRGSERSKFASDPASEPESIPEDLPPARVDPPPAGDRVATNEPVKIKIAEFSNDCTLLIPPNYREHVAHGIVVLLHRDGSGAPPKPLVERWRKACAERSLLLLIPRAAEKDGWSRPDVEFLGRAIDRTAEQYRVDPRRIVAHGVDAGGRFAAAVAGALAERIRALAVVNSPSLPINVENEPATPLAVYVASEANFSGADRLKSAVAELRKRFFSVVQRTMPAGADYPADEAFAELLRWIDSLDRI